MPECNFRTLALDTTLTFHAELRQAKVQSRARIAASVSVSAPFLATSGRERQ